MHFQEQYSLSYLRHVKIHESGVTTFQRAYVHIHKPGKVLNNEHKELLQMAKKCRAIRIVSACSYAYRADINGNGCSDRIRKGKMSHFVQSATKAFMQHGVFSRSI